MDRPRLLRLLRIAFSAVCVVCQLLIVLWVRGFSCWDSLRVRLSPTRVVMAA